ncbi:MAG: hypothetical protein KKG09_03200 [Verrucomicrobia bacterium]|nr:hypothetical protein [Verrucomicrobiota bacterium]MCG2681387.1 hypothetical protein [Kiritimatiellia bacterium]MBU4248158.1 hypothetical protein [Verrucomicrobiota bacterium]MBU4291803.1 hypothetical protein [Verrucomicrobiota bacterium]MBU4427817.1 hypothetical protein [Verrucomicrobiota bacterium]
MMDAKMTITEPRQAFGGDWTEIKLGMLGDYLNAYTTALKAQPFAKLYIDAFAGTGYRETETRESTPNLFEEQVEAESTDCESATYPQPEQRESATGMQTKAIVR